MHDMRYYGGEVISFINNTLECRPTIDRGNIRIWCDSTGTMAVFLSLDENNYRGSLEVHENGSFKSQINYHGILEFNNDCSDLVLDKSKIESFLRPWMRYKNTI